jgi:4-amino-4-deoxy-L-arabinose transferase-like glycosyltransferase
MALAERDDERPRYARLTAPEWRQLIGVTTLALVVRIVVVTAIGDRNGVFNDSSFYRQAATSLAHGQGYTPFHLPTAQWPPGWPFVLSLLYRVTGSSDYAGQLLNAVLGAATVAMLYVLVRRLFGARAGLVAAAAWSLLPGALLWTDILVAETFYTFALVAFFLLLHLLPRRTWAAAVLGVAVGLLTLSRGEGLLLLPVAVLGLWVAGQWRRNLGRSAIVVLAFVAVLAPWTIRNFRVMDAFVPVSTNASLTLWVGHNPNANGSQNYIPPNALDNVPPKDRELVGSRIYRHQAMQYMRTHPLRELELIPLKVVNLNRGDGWALDWVNDPAAKPRPIRPILDMPIRVLADAGYFALLAFTLLAVLLGRRALWRERTTRAILVLFAESLVLYGFVYYGNYRYRFPLEPLMLVLAAPLIVRLWEQRRTLFPTARALQDTSEVTRLPARPHPQRVDSDEREDVPVARLSS